MMMIDEKENEREMRENRERKSGSLLVDGLCWLADNSTIWEGEKNVRK